MKNAFGAVEEAGKVLVKLMKEAGYKPREIAADLNDFGGISLRVDLVPIVHVPEPTKFYPPYAATEEAPAKGKRK